MNACICSVLLIILLLGTSRPAAAVPELLQRSRPVELHPGTLREELDQLADVMDVDISYNPDPCLQVQLAGLGGQLSLGSALDALLAGTALRYRVVNERTIKVMPPTESDLAKQPALRNERVRRCAMAETGSRATIVEPLEIVDQERPFVTIYGSDKGQDPTGFGSPNLAFPKLTLQELGYPTLVDFFDHYFLNLPSNTRSTFGVGDPHNGALGVGVNLLGLGERATVVLINGHRIAYSALGDFVDISLIPDAAIEQVQIITGADTILDGADAVTGVVNIILRRNFNGAEVALRYSVPYDSNAISYAVAPTVGTNWNAGDGSFVATATFGRENALSGLDRSYSNMPGFDLTPANRDYNGFCSFSQRFPAGLSVSAEALFGRRITVHNINYALDGVQVGPYSQHAVTDQYTVASAIVWSPNERWSLTGDLDVSTNRFFEDTSTPPNAIASVSASPSTTRSDSTVGTGDLRLSSWTPSPSGSPGRAEIGIGERLEHYASSGTAVASFAPGSFDRHVESAYSLLLLPLVKDFRYADELDLSLGVRLENYSDIGVSTTPKVDLIWRLLGRLRMRGMYGVSFSPPRYTDTLTTYNTLVIQRITGPGCFSGPCLLAEEFGARSQYKPERSTSFNLGLDWISDGPVGLSVQSNLYLIRYRDQIALPPNVESLLMTPGAFPGLVVTDPTGAYMSTVLTRAAGYPQGILNLAGAYTPDGFSKYVDQRLVNLAETRAAGVDLSVNYTLRGPFGYWTPGASAHRVLTLDDRASPTSASISVADTFAHPVSHHYEAHLALQSKVLRATVRMNYVGSYRNDQLTPAMSISSWTTLDASIQLLLDKLMPSLGEGSRIQLTLANALNRDPPYVRTPFVPLGYDPVNSSAMGRSISIQLVVRTKSRP